MKKRVGLSVASDKGRHARFSRVCPSALVFVASLGIWLPKADAATLVNLDVTGYPLGPANALTNTGTVPGDFVSVGAIVPGVSNIDGIHGVGMLDVAGTASGAGVGQQYQGPATPTAVGGANPRTIEAWIFDPGPRITGQNQIQFEKTIFSMGRRVAGGNFVLEHGYSEDVGAVSTAIEQSTALGSIGWNGDSNIVTNNWTYLAATYDGQTLSVYSDGVLRNSENYATNLQVINTALRSSDNSTRTLMRIARQSIDNVSATASGQGIGPFYLGRLRVQDTYMTSAQVLAQYNAEKAAFNYTDSDGNGMADWWEIRYFGAMGQNPAADPDGDGLTNLQEYNARTNPLLADTDGDGLTDAQEVNIYHTDPTKADTDGDGLSDGYEVNVSHTNPLLADTDGDGFSDGVEVAKGTDPNSAASFPSPLVNLDATGLTTGPLARWTNSGTIGGTFDSVSATNRPWVTSYFGVTCVHFTTVGGSGTNGTSYLGPAVPTQLTGSGARTIEAWIFNSTAQDEETMFAWGARAGSAATGANVSFGEGRNAGFGAVQQWGQCDIGWNNQEVYGSWVNLAYTYDGTNTTRVYVDGKLANSDIDTPPLATAALDAAGQPYHFRIARQNVGVTMPASGPATGFYTNIDGTGFGEFAMSRVRVYDVMLDAATLLAHFNAEKRIYTGGTNDTDGDGMPDWFEDAYGLDKYNPGDASLDKDGDGLTNLEEFLLGTRPDVADTDGDGVSDGDEVHRINPLTGLPQPTNPLDPDTDHDGLPDGVETGTGVFICASDTGTDPTKVDTDGDGDPDGLEVANGTDPTDPNSFCHCQIIDLPPPPCPVVNLDAAKIPFGSLSTWTNKGAILGSFVVPTNATAPLVVLANSIRAVMFDGTGSAAGPQLIGPEVPEYQVNPFHVFSLTTNGVRTVEAWVHDSTAQSDKTIFAWGRRGGSAPEGENFALGHGTNATSGALDTGGSADLGWSNASVFGRWSYIVWTVSEVAVGSGTNAYYTNFVSTYVDGQLAATQTNTLNTAAFAADAPNSSTDSTNRLHFRIGRQNTDTGEADGNGIGAFELAKVRVWDVVMSAASIQHRFDAERLQFLPPLRIDNISVNSNNSATALSWAPGPGRSVSLEASTNLAGWSLIASNLTGAGYTDLATNPAPQQKFYRLRTP
jgi:hypothetical protein